ncbi:hypothetical protein F0562_029640 [Nyssa sinensis]|uniref:RING-type domain-containing protein n=1 Tax=Nyssa sinensis TaxID=561372 RepID=A0A5J5B3L7_9ASTE|nr:hypothetical protein F0562_029640 [Nyssa sinensis]
MAVEARHMNLFPPQVLISNRDFIKTNEADAQIYDSHMGSALPFAGTMPETLLPFPVMKADSGLTYNLPAPRKRSRDSFNQLNANLYELSTYPCEEDVSFLIQQQQLEIDNIVAKHTKKVRLEIEERQKQHARLLVLAIGEGIAEKMKEKDEQIQRMGKFNWVLQERVKSLYLENQLWRDLAQTNEAAANSLRINLEQVLAHVSDKRVSGGGGGGGVADDAESCCDSSDYGKDHKERELEEGRTLAGEGEGVKDKEVVGGSDEEKYCGKRRMCRKCGWRESCVLLLPCRHLCLCTICGSTLLHTCPLCNSSMTATIHVNMSSRIHTEYSLM